MYGSGAMGGTVNVFSKQGAGEFKRNLNYNTGNNKTHNINYSYGGSDENKDFYDDKINTAKFYFDKVLPRAEQHYKAAISGSSNIMNFKFN